LELGASKDKAPKRVKSFDLIKIQEDLATSSYDQMKFIKFKMVIEDSGVGIKKENLGKIFQDYSRLDEHQEMNAKGTGLGMSICKNIIEQMGGKCTIDSEVGVGSQVTITMQLKAIDKVTLVTDQI
jgi:signal transduction histidine kinase